MHGLVSQLYGKTAAWRMRVPNGTTFPVAPTFCEVFYKYTTTVDDGSLYIFYGSGRLGTVSGGWFKLDNAYYAA